MIVGDNSTHPPGRSIHVVGRPGEGEMDGWVDAAGWDGGLDRAELDRIWKRLDRSAFTSKHMYIKKI